MALTEEQKQAIETLKSADPKEFADALRTEASDLHQAIFRTGYGTAKGEYEQKLQTKEADLEAEREKAQELDREIAALREKTPDVDAIRSQYEEKLQAKEREKTEAVEAANKRVIEVHGSRFDAELAAQLIASGIEPDYAREVLVPKYRARRTVDAEGTVKVYDEDGVTPLAAANGDLARVFAGKIKAQVDPKWLISTADKGGGSGSGSGSAADGGKWDKYREQARQRTAAHGTSEANARKLASL